MKPARDMDDAELESTLAEVGDVFDDFCQKCEGMAGSPGEWMVERINELETELKRRFGPLGA